MSQDETKIKALQKLREEFPAHQIGKLPKPTKQQADAVKADYRTGIRCKVCGQWHHPDVQHLDFVGHAAITDRILDVDPFWFWEPLAFDPNGLPQFDPMGGLWIRLTICGMSRLGYGHAEGKKGGDAIKESIGDALRNAAMRFGAALDLWHKGDLHLDDDDAPKPQQPAAQEGKWSIDELEEFETTKDRAWSAFQAAGQSEEAFIKFMGPWTKRKQTDPAEKVLTGFAALVNKLEETSKMRAA